MMSSDIITFPALDEWGIGNPDIPWTLGRSADSTRHPQGGSTGFLAPESIATFAGGDRGEVDGVLASAVGEI